MVTRNGYVNVVTEDGRYIGEHRAVMESHLGRPLEPFENVHHLNGDREDNRLDNLELWFKPQPAGQRVDQLLDYIIKHHRDEIEKRIHA